MAFIHHSNASRFSIQAQTEAAVCMKNLSNWTPAVAEIRTWPEYTPQPLRTLPGLAQKLGVNQVFVKDESKRFGAYFGSFKAIGAPYAVYKILAVIQRQEFGRHQSSCVLLNIATLPKV